MSRFTTTQPWLSTLCRLVLAGVFLYSGWEKFTDSDATYRSVQAFQILPDGAVRPFAYGLPVVELLLGLLLLGGLLSRLAGIAAGVLMLVFIGGIISAWARGLSIDCGCFGNTGKTVVDPVAGYIKDLFRDTGFLLLAAFLARWPRSRFSLDQALGLVVPVIPGDSPDPISPDPGADHLEHQS